MSPEHIMDSPSSVLIDETFSIGVRLKKGVSRASLLDRVDELEEMIKKCEIRNWKPFVIPFGEGEMSPATPPIDGILRLSDMIVSIMIGSVRCRDGETIRMEGKMSEEQLHVYLPCQDEPLSQEISVDNSSDCSTGSMHWGLPSIHFEKIWENLIYDTELKNELLSYVHSLIRLSSKGTDSRIINVNRLILLLGPPGTGKTSLCKAIAQQVSITMKQQYPRATFIEINSHSLFSKWFSESGKLVMKMFDQIEEAAEDRKSLVFVLIDEVESLGMARDLSSSRGDPADSVRAVNALLTQIDRIRRHPNVFILCTSNLSECLDRALMDRADLVRHVGLPSTHALYRILYECVMELQRIGICLPSSSKGSQLDSLDHLDSSNHNSLTKQLLSVASCAKGLSGRSIRQIPALAYSKQITDTVSVEECLNLFQLAIDEKCGELNNSKLRSGACVDQ